MLYAFDINRKNRELLAALLKSHTLEQLNTIPQRFNNNLIWNMGHVIATQQLLTYGLSKQSFTISQSFIDTYKKGTRPELPATEAEVAAVQSALFATQEQLRYDYEKGIFTQFTPYTLSTTGGTLSTIEEAIEFNNFHEGLHLGTCLSYRKLVNL